MSDPKWTPGTGQKIERLYAWVATEPDGGEGIVGVQTSNGWLPLIGADRARIESYRHTAEQVARQAGFPVAMKVFSNGVVIDTAE